MMKAPVMKRTNPKPDKQIKSIDDVINYCTKTFQQQLDDYYIFKKDEFNKKLRDIVVPIVIETIQGLVKKDE